MVGGALTIQFAGKIRRTNFGGPSPGSVPVASHPSHVAIDIACSEEGSREWPRSAGDEGSDSDRSHDRYRTLRTSPPTGCRVRHCAGSTTRLRGASSTMSNRAPSGSAMRSAAPAERQAAGVPSAWSQPSQSTHERPCRWCDAGPQGRQSVPADQKAGDNFGPRDRRHRNGSRSKMVGAGTSVRGQHRVPGTPPSTARMAVATPPKPAGVKRQRPRQQP